ncbi:MAG: chalcone isomerase family protein [Gammaproteobacteria bacterium]|nr:chalcone isomerase family protein [Gammaproteobacteria bacterium]
MPRLLIPALLFLCLASPAQAKELAGVTVADTIISANQETLILNGMGLREKLWIDIYVGSLYLAKASYNVADILSQPNAFRIQLDFVYSEVTPEKLLIAWKEGFEKNQSAEKLKALKAEISSFYGLFNESALKGDRYIIDYVPDKGTSLSKNDVLLGIILGEDFKNALLEIWLGNHPADKKLKKGMLGLE